MSVYEEYVTDMTQHVKGSVLFTVYSISFSALCCSSNSACVDTQVSEQLFSMVVATHFTSSHPVRLLLQSLNAEDTTQECF